MAGNPPAATFSHLLRIPRLDCHTAAPYLREKGAVNVGVGDNLRGLMGLNKFIRHIAGQRFILFIQKVIINKNPLSDIGMVLECRFPDEFRFPYEFPYLIRMPLMAEDFNLGRRPIFRCCKKSRSDQDAKD